MSGNDGKETGSGSDGSSKAPPKSEDNRLFIVSAPSGAGKTTLCHAVLNTFTDISYSISYTTRKPRPGEREGVDYHFIDRAAFQKGLSEGMWAESAEVHGWYYGTSSRSIEDELAAGRDVLLDLDVKGASQLMAAYPSAVAIFIMPPSMDVLAERLRRRGTDSQEEIAKRLHNARREIECRDRYHHVIVNDRLPDAISELTEIIQGYRSPQAGLGGPL